MNYGPMDCSKKQLGNLNRTGGLTMLNRMRRVSLTDSVRLNLGSLLSSFNAWSPVRIHRPSTSNVVSDTPSLSQTEIVCFATMGCDGEREFFVDNLMVRIHLIIEMIFSRPALRHGSLNSLFQIAL